MKTWKEYNFVSLNDLANYETEINKTAGKKQIYTYSGDTIISGTAWGRDQHATVTFIDFTTKDYPFEEDRSLQIEGTLKDYFSIEVYETETEELLARYNCFEGVNDTIAIDIVGDFNYPIQTTRVLNRLQNDWSHMIERAKLDLGRELTNYYDNRNFDLDSTIDKIDNKHYFKSAIIFLTLSYIFSDLSLGASADLYEYKSDSYKKKFNRELKVIIELIDFDTDGDGTVDIDHVTATDTIGRSYEGKVTLW